MLGSDFQRSWGISAASQVQYPDDPDVSKLSFLAGWNLELLKTMLMGFQKFQNTELPPALSAIFPKFSINFIGTVWDRDEKRSDFEGPPGSIGSARSGRCRSSCLLGTRWPLSMRTPRKRRLGGNSATLGIHRLVGLPPLDV